MKNFFNYHIIDLTHTLNENTPTWHGECGFNQAITLDYADWNTDVKFRVQKLNMHAGIGTHLDAPAHCFPNGAAVNELKLEDLIAPCVVIDVSSVAHAEYSVSIEDIQAFEATYGLIAPRSCVMIYTGWDRFWTQPEQYRNGHVFPSVSNEAAQLLLTRDIVGLGIDTLSPDRLADGFLVHTTLLGSGKYLIENATHLNQLPPTGSFIFALPIKTQYGTEAPIRLIALVPKT